VKRHWGLLRYGLLKTTGQADGFRVLKVKTAYYAIQNAVSVFNDAWECVSPETTSEIEIKGAKRAEVYDWKDRETGTPVVLFWDSSAMPQDENVTKPAAVKVKGEPVANPVWVDVLTGNVFKITEDMISTSKGTTTYFVPAYDSPVFITSQDILDLHYSWYVREGKAMKQYKH
jgi:hypothetical protein